MDTNKKRPSKDNNNDLVEKHLGIWIANQKSLYITRTNIMTNIQVYNMWDSFINNPSYCEYFKHNDNINIWKKNLSDVKSYIDINMKKPSKNDTDTNVKKLANWLSYQSGIYARRAEIMKNSDIFTLWSTFINSTDYSKYFQNNIIKWYTTHESVKLYINTHKKRPTIADKDPKIRKLASWISVQIINYSERKQLMANPDIYNSWTATVTNPTYSEYFIDNITIWNKYLSDVITYIDANHKKPSKQDTDPNVKKLGQWISSQTNNYNKKQRIMSNQQIYQKWTHIINDPNYKVYFENNISRWEKCFNGLKSYIDENRQLPPQNYIDINNQKIGQWLSTQKINFKKKKDIMKQQEIRDEWYKFITCGQYKEYF